MSSRIYKTWLARLQEPEMAESHIRQFRLSVWGMAYGSRGGSATNLTVGEARELVAVFDRRVNAGDPPRVTEAQADKGREWLTVYARRLGLPLDVNYRDIDHFDFIGVQSVSDNGYRVVTAAVYQAVWPDGRALTYWATPRTARSGAEFRFDMKEGAPA